MGAGFSVQFGLWSGQKCEAHFPTGIRWVLPGDEPMRGGRAQDSRSDRVQTWVCRGLQVAQVCTLANQSFVPHLLAEPARGLTVGALLD